MSRWNAPSDIDYYNSIGPRFAKVPELVATMTKGAEVIRAEAVRSIRESIDALRTEIAMTHSGDDCVRIRQLIAPLVEDMRRLEDDALARADRLER